MERAKRILTFVTFIFCVVALSMLIAALATHKWIVSKPERIKFQNVAEVAASDGKKFKGDIYFGLFYGSKTLNYGLGDRTTSIWIKEELMRNPSLMQFGLWLFTVLSIALAILFGVVCLIFGIINTVITPIEVITGIRGLFLWNGFGVLFCGSTCLSWLIQYLNKLKQNVLTQEEINDGWSSENRSRFGYSYYLVAMAMLLFLLNILIVFAAVKKPTFQGKIRSTADKNPEGVIMLY